MGNEEKPKPDISPENALVNFEHSGKKIVIRQNMTLEELHSSFTKAGIKIRVLDKIIARYLKDIEGVTSLDELITWVRENYWRSKEPIGIEEYTRIIVMRTVMKIIGDHNLHGKPEPTNIIQFNLIPKKKD